MKHVRTTTTAITLALLATGFAGSAQAADSGTGAAPDACAGVDGCKIVSRADIDGDGTADSVGLRTSPDGSGKVTTRVVTADGERLQTTTETSRSMTTASEYYRGAARIDGVDGYEIVVLTDLGAHTAYYQVITYRDGRLTTLKDPRNRWRWVTDGSVWSDFGYQRTTTATGAPKMIAREAVDNDRDGDFTQVSYSAGWKYGGWYRMGALTKKDARPSVAHRYTGWNVPYLPTGL